MKKILVLLVVSVFVMAGPSHGASLGSEPIYPEDLRQQCLEWIMKIGESAFRAPGFLSVYERLLTFDAVIKTDAKSPAVFTITHRTQVAGIEQQLTIDDSNYLIEFQQSKDSPTISLLANRYQVKGRLLVFDIIPNARISITKLIIRFDINSFYQGSIILEGLGVEPELSRRFSVVSVSSTPL